MTDFAAIRRNMVDTQLRTYDVNSKRLLDAVEAVGREHFVPPALANLAYVDQAVSIVSGEGTVRVMLQPMVLARMIQSADIQAGETILSIGGGTGYGAAVMSKMGCVVTMLEANEGLAALARESLAAAGVSNVAVLSGNLLEGHATHAPFDVIVVEGAVDAAPQTLLAQLADGGRLVCVVGHGRAGRMTVFQRSGDVFGGKNVFDASASSFDSAGPVQFRF